MPLIDTIHCTADKKATPAWVEGVGVDFKIHMHSATPNAVKRIRNKTARFRCVFGSTDGYRV